LLDRKHKTNELAGKKAKTQQRQVSPEISDKEFEITVHNKDGTF